MTVSFPKTDPVRVEQLIVELNQAAAQQDFQIPTGTVFVNEGVSVSFTNATTGVDRFVDVESLVTQFSTQVQNIIDAHVPDPYFFEFEKALKYQEDKEAIKQQVKDQIASIVGTPIQNLTTTQIRNLFFVVLWKLDGIEPSDLSVRNPNDWII